MKSPIGILLCCVFALSSCAGDFPESKAEADLPIVNLVVEEVDYLEGGNYLAVRVARQDGRSYYRIAGNYRRSQPFDIVKWITAPEADAFSLKSSLSRAYLQDGVAPPAQVTFDTAKPAYLVDEAEFFYGIPGFTLEPDEFEVVIAKCYIVTPSAEVQIHE